MLDWDNIPTELKQRALHCYQTLWPRLHEYAPFNLSHSAAIACSEFVYDTLVATPAWWVELQDPAQLVQTLLQDQQNLAIQIQQVDNEARLRADLRQFYRKSLLKLAWLQIQDQIPTTEILAHLSALAEQIVLVAQSWAYQHCCQQWGTPSDAVGQPQPLIVIAMGKLGGKELNFCSDIDLIFCYPLTGQTQGKTRRMANQQFFTKLAQKLLAILSESTAEGSLYRVDMRLRPFGDSGPLVCSFAALEHYYQEQGRDWERYALVKGRLLGYSVYHQELQQLLHPFIYRRYIDFSMIQALAEMRQMIEREVRQREWHNNIKLGEGGIREMEFIVQLFQLIRGGRTPPLRQTSFLAALEAIKQLELLSTEQSLFLQRYYLFLRRIENLLQGIQASQNHLLPQDELNQQRVYFLMGFSSWAKLRDEIKQHSQQVRQIFDQLLLPQQEESITLLPLKYRALWLDNIMIAEMITLFHIDSSQAQRIQQTIEQFKQDLSKKTIGRRGRAVLDKLIPKIAFILDQSPQGLVKIDILFNIIIKIVSRTTYLELLFNYPLALQQLIQLSTQSRFMAQQFVQYPILLDELLSHPTQLKQADANYYQQQLQQKLLRCGELDTEQTLIAVHEFKQSQQLQVAMAELQQNMQITEITQHLTWIAEAVIGFLLDQAWRDVTQRYGLPEHLTQNGQGSGLMIVGYGKLGTSEMNYASDLDLVFLYDAPQQGRTTGEKSIETRQFYFRLVQRLLHFAATPIANQMLYKIDLQLRPYGESGALIMPLSAWVDYQQQQAWIWEHQALVKARIIYADDLRLKRWENFREQILSRAAPSDLKQQIGEMRNKMLQHYQSNDATLFHPKYGRGGLNDIEFILQYLILKFAKRYPSLLTTRQTITLIQQCSALQLIPSAVAIKLQQSDEYYLHLTHQAILQNSPIEQPLNVELAQHCSWVADYWDQLMA